MLITMRKTPDLIGSSPARERDQRSAGQQDSGSVTAQIQIETGIPVVSVGRVITDEEVSNLLQEGE